MTVAQSFRMALKALNGSKMRSFLTMLGIIIGVLSVCLLVSIVQGATDEVTGQFSSLGGNTLVVNVENAGNVKLTLSDLRSLAVPENGISAVSPSLSRVGVAKSGTKSMEDATVTGVAESYVEIRSLTIDQGRGILPTDMEYRSAVAIVGSGVADQLFGHQNVLGAAINVMGRDFEIVGVLKQESASAMMSNADAIFIPYTTAERLLMNTNITQFYLSTTSVEDTPAAKAALEDFMLMRVRDEDAYKYLDQAAIMDAMNTVTGIMTGLLGGIAGISLLVGGIGIMNIMLVSVTERTREIGIRKAIGAKRKNILMQFLIEALLLSVLGGLIGLGLSWVGATAVGHAMGMNIGITGGVAALAMGFAAAVGLIFGVYPAAKASRLAPIQALRYE